MIPFTMNVPKISIVVPSFNQGRYLEETLTSILGQNYPDLELFVVDGGSTDNSVDIIKKYESRIDWWVSEKDKGQSEAINKGFRRATGEIITWINSDDLLTDGALEKVAHYFQTLPADTGLIHGGATLFRGDKVLRTDWGYHDPSLERNLAGMAFSQPSAFFLKKFLDKVGGSVREDLHYGMDYDLYCRLSCVCRFVPVKDIFSKYRLHDSSKTVKESDKFITDWNCVFVNLCKNNNWIGLLEEFQSLEQLDKKTIEYFYQFTFIPDQGIMNNVDKKKLLFYHLNYILKSLYGVDRRADARKLLKKIKASFPSEWIKNENNSKPVIMRLSLPDFVLTTFKKIKRML